MTLHSSKQSADNLWGRAIVATIIGILVGTFNRDIVTVIGGDNSPARLVGYAFGGIVASAIQGAFLRRYTQPKWAWLGISAIGWIVIGLPDVWSVDFSYWLCDRLGRWTITGAMSGGCVGLIQSVALWRYPQILKAWTPMNIAIWTGMWMLPVIIFGSLLRGEGSCLQSFPF